MTNLEDPAATLARIEFLDDDNRRLAEELARIRGVPASAPTSSAPATSRPTDRSAWIGLACGLVLLALNIAMCDQSAG